MTDGRVRRPRPSFESVPSPVERVDVLALDECLRPSGCDVGDSARVSTRQSCSSCGVSPIGPCLNGESMRRNNRTYPYYSVECIYIYLEAAGASEYLSWLGHAVTRPPRTAFPERLRETDGAEIIHERGM